LLKAITRRNGQYGESVTHNVLVIKNIPNSFNCFEDIEIRGEVYMKNSVFNSLNKLGNQFANPRNAA